MIKSGIERTNLAFYLTSLVNDGQDKTCFVLRRDGAAVFWYVVWELRSLMGAAY